MTKGHALLMSVGRQERAWRISLNICFVTVDLVEASFSDDYRASGCLPAHVIIG